MPKIIGIARVSTNEQAGRDGEGLERQRASIRAIGIAQKTTIKIINVTGVSGSDLADTPEWRDELAPAIRAGASLAVDAPDRVVRASAFDLRTLEVLTTAGGKLFTPSRVYDTTNAQDRFSLLVFAGVGGLEKAELVRRAQAGKEEKRKRGEWVSRLDATPYGTIYSRTTRRWSYDPTKADAVKDAFTRYASGATLGQVARLLEVSDAGAKVVLRNRIYVGLLRYDKKRGEKYASVDGRQADRRRIRRPDDQIIEVRVYGLEGQEPALVTEALYDAVQSRLGESAKSGRSRRERTAPLIYLSGFMGSDYEEVAPDAINFVPELGASWKHVIYGSSGGEGRTVHYHCRCRQDLGSDPGSPRPRCKLTYLPALYVNRAVDAYLSDFTNQPGSLDTIKQSLVTKKGSTTGQRTKLEKMIRDGEKKERTLIDLVAEGRVSPDDFRKRQDDIRTQRADAQKALSALDAGDVGPTPAQIDWMARFWAYNAAWTPDMKRTWLARFVKMIKLSNDGIESVELRVPESAVSFGWSHSATWIDLLDGDIRTAEGRLASDGLYTAGVVVWRLAVLHKISIAVDQLAYLVRSGQVPTPNNTWGLKKIWTKDEFETLAKALKSKAA